MKALLLAVAIGVASPKYAGRPLLEALRLLESSGLHLVYSEEIVPPALIVDAEPRSTEPRKILDELLAPHRLRAVAGPRDTLVIVRVQERAPRKPVMLSEIVVTPSHFQVLAGTQFLGRDEVRSLPHAADDLYRALARLPGTTSDDITARPNLRGGTQDEVAVIVDGAEVYDPFHMRDLMRAFSTIDAEAVGDVSLLSGGFPAEYGGRMGGIIDVNTLTPARNRTEVGLSILNTRVLSQGVFGRGRGEWLLSLRHGYLREVLQMIGLTGFKPQYDDATGKVQWTFRDSTLLSLHFLGSRDRFRNDDIGSTASAKYGDRYVWLNLRTAARERLYLQSVLSMRESTTDRHGKYGLPGWDEAGSADDVRSANMIAWKNDATVDFAHHVIKGGVALRRVHASYAYNGSGTIRFGPKLEGGPPPSFVRATNLKVQGSELSAYVADRVQLGARGVFEAGARLDDASYAPGSARVAPRVNVLLNASDRTSVRLAWGRFIQTQRIDDLPVEDGISTFERPQSADHRVIGVDHAFAGGWTGRAEFYDKRFKDLRTRFENAFDRVVLFAELRGDRIAIHPEAASARGVEVLVRSDFAKPFSGWLSYSRATATDRIHGVDVPRAWDQRDTMTAGINVRRGSAWNFNAVATTHTGWPTTPVAGSVVGGRLVLTGGALNSLRLPSYKRVDFRVSREFRVRHSAVSAFVEVFNALNWSNVVHVDYFDVIEGPRGAVQVVPRYESLVTALPSFGITWQFGRY